MEPNALFIVHDGDVRSSSLDVHTIGIAVVCAEAVQARCEQNPPRDVMAACGKRMSVGSPACRIARCADAYSRVYLSQALNHHGFMSCAVVAALPT